MDVTVVVATYGDRSWQKMAERAAASAGALDVPVIAVHAPNHRLHDVRNAALAAVETEWVCHLDADDELEPGYFDAIAQGHADLRAPAVRYVKPGRRLSPPPTVPRVAGHDHDCTAECIASGAGNWLVVGTVARVGLLRNIGGWRDFPMYEDFDLWMRAIRHGATVEAVPDAVYRATVNPGSRNRAPSIAEKNRVHREIVTDVLGHRALIEV